MSSLSSSKRGNKNQKLFPSIPGSQRSKTPAWATPMKTISGSMKKGSFLEEDSLVEHPTVHSIPGSPRNEIKRSPRTNRIKFQNSNVNQNDSIYSTLESSPQSMSHTIQNDYQTAVKHSFPLEQNNFSMNEDFIVDEPNKWDQVKHVFFYRLCDILSETWHVYTFKNTESYIRLSTISLYLLQLLWLYYFYWFPLRSLYLNQDRRRSSSEGHIIARFDWSWTINFDWIWQDQQWRQVRKYSVDFFDIRIILFMRL